MQTAITDLGPWLRLCRAAVGTVAVLLVAEGAVRVANFGLDGVAYAWRYQYEKFLDSELVRSTDDPLLPYGLRADVDTYYNGGTFLTNAHGFRGPEVSVQKPEGVVRVIVLGSSYSLGQGVDQEDTYPAQLERLLNENLPGQYEVLNLAVPNYRLPEMLRAYETLARRFDPDIVLVEFYDEYLRSYRGMRPPSLPPPGEITPRRVARQYSFAYTAARRFTLSQGLGAWSSRVSEARGSKRPGRPGRHRAAPVAVETGCDAIARLVDTERDRGGDVVLVSLARLTDLERTGPLVPATQRCCRSVADCRVIETVDRVRASASSSDAVFYGNNHPNAHVTRLYAEAIYEELTAILSAPHVGLAGAAGPG
jgi:hypothetical protein